MKLRTLWLLIVLLSGSGAFGASKSLERELKDLDVQDTLPNAKLSDRLYSVQPRMVPLTGKVQLLAGAAQNYSGSGFLDTTQFSVGGQYHFNDRWSLAGAYSRVSNKFTKSADQLLQTGGYLPDVDYARSRTEIRAVYNLFYGKFRFTRTQALSFDQYFGLGLASHDLRSGNTVGVVGDFGFTFWISPKYAVHLGAKDYYYRENRTLSKGYSHNVHGYLDAGLVF